MAAIQIGNVSEEIAFNDFTINVDLLDLASIYDAGLIKFIYGQQPDLSDGTTLSQAMFATGSTSQVIDGLTEGETYYYKVVADTVAYDSSLSVENVFNEQGFMEELFATPTQNAKILSSTNLLNNMFGSQSFTEKFWNISFGNRDTGNVIYSLVTGDYGGYALKMEGTTDDDTHYLAKSVFDLTDYNTMKIKLDFHNDFFSYTRIYIDGDSVFYENNMSGSTELNLDISQYGEVQVEIGGKNRGSNDSCLGVTWQYIILEE